MSIKGKEERGTPVNHPSHYNEHESGIECITIVQGFNFNVGNVIKYAWRAGLKSPDPEQDLMKARKYIDFELARRERLRRKLIEEVKEQWEKGEGMTPSQVDATAVTDQRFAPPEEDSKIEPAEFFGVTGEPCPEPLLRDLPEPPSHLGTTATKLAKLLILHHEKFPKLSITDWNWLKEMGEVEKLDLLTEMRETLGIKPLRDRGE